MGTKPATTYYRPALRVFATFHRNERRPPEALREDLEKIIGDTAQEYPWRTDYYLENKNGVFKFERFNSNVSAEFRWIIRDKRSDWNSPNDIEFKLSLSGAIKGSQILSIIRHGEMLGRIISARYSTLRSLIVHACFEAPAYEISQRSPEPGDIVERSSSPGKYFYFDSLDADCRTLVRRMCHVTCIENIGKISDRITTPWADNIFTSVDHLPQLTTEESSRLVYGMNIGPREPLIAKWRPGYEGLNAPTTDTQGSDIPMSPPAS
ncbi:MAG: hypothetical protein A3C93_00430 [Candidatus Lloydbacteria bacterium RIFCSPHIGHO2_02_FULL_54_17]|uniref:Uncharacterized protein n=1 Tax=Candidatus Lloydbacteria bacterium RIFCSPHIGHO2_02_FULL_54_17 TaxID=1798664 RepID=A0A1G2DDY9_9BACT|nr:MAG: hypothetical protein A2762_01870 [Candidatus Lloydbacteria bacterium RIFCSPHIGHO2_01_FULL_54_11]OGZ11854.1 MAG: hypothetical protein A3C93_00430 [Candidatus Lloydbacteria bacterium RIFCSPHIGHO2_02_FULL_54_17]OGZ14125.1 MAG: hypothetical protein A2948_03355 [Candidatus Lloydbacteria bacterium RIFCSPLOWO2_01_FULL_54_18]OGZ16698.1 MAG: hypothetical protein A3H76_00135 [Candidatus Lloydbacteria bacterium RIFCSPLOWO2_02_FULL_54_12]